MSAKRESSAEGARNERFSASKVCRFTLVPSDTVAPNSFHWYNTNTWSVAQTKLAVIARKMIRIYHELSQTTDHQCLSVCAQTGLGKIGELFLWKYFDLREILLCHMKKYIDWLTKILTIYFTTSLMACLNFNAI